MPGPVPSAVGSAEGLPIARIEMRPRNIFDPVPPGPMAPLYRLANRLHIRTRASTIREQLLFGRGDRWSDAVGRETERNLRQLNFLTPEPIQAHRQGDSATVTVETRDIWSTTPEFNLESADRKRYGSISFTERNLLGMGKSFSVAYREDPSGKSRAVFLDDPAVAGSRLRLHFDASDGSSGATNRISIGMPFYAEDAPVTYGMGWRRATSVVRLYQQAAEIADLDQRLEEVELFWGRGRRDAERVHRVIHSVLVHDRRLGPTRHQPEAPPEFVAGEGSQRLRRLATESQWWWPNFIERINVDRMALVEDFDVGVSAALKFGVAPEFLGSKANEGFAQMRLGAGRVTSLGFGWIQLSASSRLRREPREFLAEMDARWVYQPSAGNALVLGTLAVVGARRERDFQVVVGGLNGLRAYPVQALAGRRLIRLNVEDRWTVRTNLRNLLALGVVVFADGARAWGPGSTNAGWFASVGTGARISFPQWSPTQVVRIDVAWPLSPTRDGRRDAVLSFGSQQAF